jgi:hypothetical protein
MVEVIQDCLHETEDSTLYVPAAIAKLAYAPGDAIRKKVRATSLPIFFEHELCTYVQCSL